MWDEVGIAFEIFTSPLFGTTLDFAEISAVAPRKEHDIEDCGSVA